MSRFLRRLLCGSALVAFATSGWAAARVVPTPPAATAAAPEADVTTAPSAGAAASAYAEGRYADAARGFEALADAQGVSASLYYDLGAAQLAAGALGPAIASFERAHWLAPWDRGIDTALAKAREQAGVSSPVLPWWMRARDVLGADAWALVAWMLLALTCGLVSLPLLAPARVARGTRGRKAIALATAGCCAALLAAAFACASLWRDSFLAVVLPPELALRIAPFEGAEARTMLSAGEAVRVEARHGGFLRVEAGTGRSGWVPERALSAVVPG